MVSNSVVIDIYIYLWFMDSWGWNKKQQHAQRQDEESRQGDKGEELDGISPPSPTWFIWQQSPLCSVECFTS